MLWALALLLLSGSERQPQSNNLDAAGILQLTWLLGNDGHFTGIRKPDLHGLRRAGMFKVQMSAWAQDKIDQSSRSCDVLELDRLNSRQYTVDSEY